ncbi:KRAB-A domain-containing protein [Schistosoma mansoni]|uniref:KRAB-A domain-containing protein n=1 Tax=Schistosoma mansoni TaxID=6183 RepID=UPI00022DC3C9|nr:KRAB-A domain-containing protein [Schistosoma mansoni]|eukprot:XP_018648667.1 KRAB-A domain-containing protein [Schistosoma mansoni]
MEVFTKKRDENLNEPPVIPVKPTTGSAPRQPPLLENSSDYTVWKFKVVAYLRKVPASEQFDYLVSYLSDEATKRAIVNGFAADNTLAQNWKILDDCFSTPVDPQQAAIRFLSRHQTPGENPMDYFNSLQQMAVQAFPCLDATGRDELIKSRFVEGLLSSTLKEHCLLNPPTDINSLKRVTFRFMAAEQLKSPLDMHQPTAMAVMQPTKASRPLNPQRISNVTRSSHWNSSRRQFNPTEKKWRPTNSYHGRQSECPYCRRFGKNAKKCGHNRFGNTSKPYIFHLSSYANHVRPITIKARVQGIDIEVLLDTGASVSLIKSEFLGRLNRKVQQTRHPSTLLTASGDPLKVNSKVWLDLMIDRHSFRHGFLVCPTLTWDMILGVDFMLEHKACIFMDSLEAKFGETKIRLHHTNTPFKVVSYVGISDLVRQVNDKRTLKEKDRHATIAVLQQFSSVFEESISGNRTSTVQHTICTGDHRPLRQPPRRVPVHYQPQLDTMIKDMLDKNIIVPSSSPWASPIVLVKKKDSSLRLCIDYRRLNAITKRDSFPLPRIDAILDALSGACWFSTLDLASGYWQVEVRPQDRKKTAFVVPNGLYEFQVMPFGLTNAPATFQRLMQTVLQDIVPHKCLIYLDDIIVYGSTPEQHNANLKAVLHRLQQHNLKVKPSKCRLLQKEVVFLGHRITADGVGTDKEKTRVIVNWPQPKSPEDVRSFLGLASYYRRFVRDFASLAAPLHRLTHKGRKFLWTTECQQAFDVLKTRLSSPPILAVPDTSVSGGEFILDTDASSSAIGAVLSQVAPDGQERVIAYASRRLDKSETRYSTTRREMLALVKFLQHFRHYLLGKPFRVRTDHRALQWLRSFREPEGQVARWQERLQEFDFTCEYRPGSRHTNADALSRIPQTAGTVNAVLSTAVEIDWPSLQAADPDMQIIYQRQLQGNHKPSMKELKDQSLTTRRICTKWSNLKLYGDTLFLINEARQPLLVVPRIKVESIVEQVHRELGHAGERRTEYAVRQRFWWPSMHEDVVQICKNCNTCYRFKSPRQTSRAPLTPMVTTGPHQRVGIDIMGPLTTTKKGNRYILVMVDYFTKWCEAVPLPQQDALTVARAFIDHWVSRYGAPFSLHSDQGPAFESRLIAEICQLLGIRKTRTTAYHPEGNGLVERTNRSIKAILQAFVSRSSQELWDDVLPQCLLAYRTSVHGSTGFSPAILLFGHELRLPVEIQTPLLPCEEQEHVPYIRTLRNRLADAYRLVSSNLRKASEHQKDLYDRRVHGPVYKVGDRVWLRRPMASSGSCSKFHQPWQGPFEIVLIRSPTTFVLRNLQRPQDDVMIVHYNQIKPDKMTVSSDTQFANPPPATTFYEVPSEGGTAYPCPRPGTEDSAYLREGAV